jgi:HTH-type transcriptional regulator/antitoxin HipB
MDQATRTRTQLGAILRRARKTKGLTQGALAEQVNKRQATVSNLESPEGGATLETLFAVLSALELELVVRPRTKGSLESLADVF